MSYHKVRPHGQPLAILDLAHAELGRHVIVGRLVSYAPSHVDDLCNRQNHTALAIACINKAITRQLHSASPYQSSVKRGKTSRKFRPRARGASSIAVVRLVGTYLPTREINFRRLLSQGH